MDVNVPEDDYQHALSIWKQLNLKTLDEYHDWYLKTDVLLLCDVYENFWTFCLKHFTHAWSGSLHYSPKFWLGCVLKEDWGGIAIRYKLLTCITGSKAVFEEVYRWYLTGMQRRITHYYLTLIKNYWIFALCIWMRTICMAAAWFRSYLSVEFDSEYLHDCHNDYPLAPEKLYISDNMLSTYCKELKEDLHCISRNCPIWCIRRNTSCIAKSSALSEIGYGLNYVQRVVEFKQRA